MIVPGSSRVIGPDLGLEPGIAVAKMETVNVVMSSGMSAVYALVHSALNDAVARIAADALAAVLATNAPRPLVQDTFLSSPLFDRKALAVLPTKCRVCDDIDALELYALGAMASIHTKIGRQVGNLQVPILESITVRVHELLECRPDLLSRPFRFMRRSSTKPVDALRYLVVQSVSLDPTRLVRLRSLSPVHQRHLQAALNEGNDCVDPVFEASTRVDQPSLTTSTALLGVAPEFASRVNAADVALLCGTAAAGSRWQYQAAVEFLQALRNCQDLAGGDERRIVLEVPVEDVFETMDMAWASTATAHPVLALLYGAAIGSASGARLGAFETPRNPVEGFPAAPLTRLGELLNSVLAPGCRLPLEKLSGLDVLKLVTLCPGARNEAKSADFWEWFRGGPGDGASDTYSPWGLARWSIAGTNFPGVSMSTADLDSVMERVAPVIGNAWFNETRAGLVHREMAARLVAIEKVPPTSKARNGGSRRGAACL